MNGSTAVAAIGSGNHAVAVNNSDAQAVTGDDNRAVAINNSGTGLHAPVTAGGGNNNPATAVNGSTALVDGGNNSSGTAINDSIAIVHGTDGTALATNGGCALGVGSGQTVRNHGTGCP